MNEYENIAAEIPDYNLQGEAYDTQAVLALVRENAASGMGWDAAVEAAAKRFEITEEAVTAIFKVAEMDLF